ncbi:helix-turn-helix transcriptional regulator [Fluviicola sp.]|uniref:helix-turn-helix transcriptional regulator n=1 Tax=Fluviicola sp. TaxID=1917219 RepID=UPI0031E38A71
MRKSNRTIPVNSMDEDFTRGISIDKLSIHKSDFKTVEQHETATESHRDEGHTFHIVEKGTITIEIDFKKHIVTAPAVVYMHPNQVHRILDFSEVTVCSMAIKEENIHPDYLQFLEEIAPADPLALTAEANSVVSSTFSLCQQFSLLKNNKLHHSLLKDSCNTLIAFLLSQFLNQQKAGTNLSRFEQVTKSFRQVLEKNFHTLKRPGEYAEKLNISTSYLNECIRNTTGISASQYIRDRIILEAKRLLHHSDKSVKEIAFELGYVDYSYFARLFTTATGISAGAFRNKNRD